MTDTTIKCINYDCDFEVQGYTSQLFDFVDGKCPNCRMVGTLKYKHIVKGYVFSDWDIVRMCTRWEEDDHTLWGFDLGYN